MFHTEAGKFRGKPFPTRYNKYGLPCVVIVPSKDDDRTTFVNEKTAIDDDELLAMGHMYNDDKTPNQRLQECINSMPTIDSYELPVECFADSRWPDKTDLKCWWCLHGFDTKPFPCPLSVSCDGIFRIQGVFCGPSCAKAWAATRTCNPSKVVYPCIDRLAVSRGFMDPKSNRRYVYIPPAPPREALKIFSGEGGMTIEEFRGMCACGFDVKMLEPPTITYKQVIVAECNNLISFEKSRKGKAIIHKESIESMTQSATDIAMKKRQGLSIFAGVGARRLTEFFGSQTTKSEPEKRKLPQTKDTEGNKRRKINN